MVGFLQRQIVRVVGYIRFGRFSSVFTVTVVGYDLSRSVFWTVEWYLRSVMTFFGRFSVFIFKKRVPLFLFISITYDQQPTNIRHLTRSYGNLHQAVLMLRDKEPMRFLVDLVSFSVDFSFPVLSHINN